MKNIFIALLLAYVNLPSTAKAADPSKWFDFTAEETVYQCPIGAEYPVMQCKVLSTVTVPVHLEMLAYGDNYYQGAWTADLSGAHFEMISSAFVNVYTGATFSLNLGAGYSADSDLDSTIYAEYDPAHLPYDTFMYGSRKRVNATTELVPALTISSLKY